MMVIKKEEVDTSFCIIEDDDDVELFLGKQKLTKEERRDLEIDTVGEFEI